MTVTKSKQNIIDGVGMKRILSMLLFGGAWMYFGQSFGIGPAWAWSGCMDPGMGTTGCAQVVPLAAFAFGIVGMLNGLAVHEIGRRWLS